jgi:hypothetical protein
MLCEFHATHHEDQSNESDNQENVPKETTSSALLQIKKNENIQYKLPDSEEWISATVLDHNLPPPHMYQNDIVFEVLIVLQFHSLYHQHHQLYELPHLYTIPF